MNRSDLIWIFKEKFDESYKGKTSPPYIYRVTWPIEGNQANQNKPKSLLPLFYLFLSLFFSYPTNSVLTLNYCSSLVPVVIEGVLAGLADARIDPRRSCQTGSLWAGVRWILCGDPWRLVCPVAYTSLTDWLIQRLARLICSPRMSRCFSTWPDLTSTHFLVTRLGKKYFGFYSQKQFLAIWCLNN
jgi:hypothetical protein